MNKNLLLVALFAFLLGGVSLSAQTFPCGTNVTEDCNCDGTGSLVADSAPCVTNSGEAQLFLLVDAVNAVITTDLDDNSIVQVSGTGAFNNVATGDYIMYSIVYDIADASTIFPLVSQGQSIAGIQGMGVEVSAGTWTGTNPSFELFASGITVVNGPSCDCGGTGTTGTDGGTETTGTDGGTGTTATSGTDGGTGTTATTGTDGGTGTTATTGTDGGTGTTGTDGGTDGSGPVVGVHTFPCGTQILDDCNCELVGTLIADSSPCGFNSGQAQIFLLVDTPNAAITTDPDDNTITQVSGSGTFNNVSTGDYLIYSLVYNVSDASTVFPLITQGSSITTIQNMGTESTSGTWEGTNPVFSLIASSLATINGAACDCGGTGGGTATAGGTDTGGGGTNCSEILSDQDVSCNYAAGTYTMVLTLDGLNGIGVQGYQVTSTHANGFNGIVFGSFVDGPFLSPEGYDYTITSVLDPSCSITISTNTVECIVTPIEFLAFEGQEAGKANYLYWATGSEVNNSHFNLLRSTDGMNFNKVSEIASQGNSTSVQNYEFFDYNFSSRLSYYKLEQVDFDGAKTVVDEIVIIERSDAGFDISNVYPVPTTTTVNIDFTIDRDVVLDVTIFDMAGRLIVSQKSESVRGLNSIELDVSDLSVGTYMVTLNDGTEVVTSKFVKD